MLWKITLTLNVDEKYGDPESWDWPALLDLSSQESVAVNSELLEDRRKVG